VSSAGSLDRLALEHGNHQDLEIKEGMVKVQVKAVGLNFADIFAVQGLYSATPQGKFTPGLEFSGIILNIGENVKPVDGWRPAVGDKVMGMTRFGGYTTHLVVNAAFLRPLPPTWSFDQGASFLCTALTAWYGLVTIGGLRKGHAVLLHSAAGGVGLVALEIIKAHNATAVCTIGSPEKASLLQERHGIPATAIVVRGASGAQFSAQLDTALQSLPNKQEGFDIVMDSVQGIYFQPAFDRLSRGGKHVVFGAAAMTPPGSSPNWLRLAWQWLWRPKVDPLEIIAANKGVIGFNLIWMWDKVEDMSEIFTAMMAQVQWQPPHVGRTFAFDDAPAAMRYLQSGSSVGKVVVVVDSE